MMSFRRGRLQIFSIVSLSLIILVFIIYHIFFSSYLYSKDEVEMPEPLLVRDVTKEIFKKVLENPKREAFQGEKLIHLDLKGAPPSLSYYKQFFPFIKKLGASGVLIEYEDMFYYKDELKDIRALNAYYPSTIQKILKSAEDNGLTVIPLIQTFGHFEFVLKLEKYKDLREISRFPQVLCPNRERTLTVIKQMIDQIIEAHPQSKYIHIGCDEVLHLGQCNKCRAVMQEKNWTTANLFLNHVKNIALYINNTYPGVRPIMWDDMIRKLSEEFLKQSQIANLIDLMVWKYVPKVSEYITDETLEKYVHVFKTIWIASAFKGTTGVNQMITDVKYHLENHVGWLRIVAKWKHLINFKGIVITGWQRYDHFAELCELLPVGIPSLAICLSYLNGYEEGKNARDILKLLECDSPFSFSPISFDHPISVRNCSFPGYPVYRLINKYYTLSSRIKNHFSVVNQGWFSIYAILHNFCSPFYVKSIFEDWPLDKDRMELRELEENLKISLLEIYDVYTVDEWITNYVTPVRIRLEAFWNVRNEVLGQIVWPRRPLLNNGDGLERAAKEICTSERKFGCALLLT